MSIWLQVALGIYVATFIRKEDQILESLYRNGLITSFSIFIALLYGQTLGEYNPQQDLVIRAMGSASSLSTTSIARIRAVEYYGRTKRERGFSPYIDEPAPGTVGWLTNVLSLISLVAWLRTYVVFEFLTCGKFLYNPAETISLRALLYMALALSLITDVVLETTWCWVFKSGFKGGETEPLRVKYINCTIILWTMSCSLELIVAEYGLYVERRYDNMHPPQANGTSPEFWGIGQVIALVMLAVPLWDLIAFYCRPHKVAMYRFFQWTWILRFLVIRRKEDEMPQEESEEPEHQPDIEMDDLHQGEEQRLLHSRSLSLGGPPRSAEDEMPHNPRINTV